MDDSNPVCVSISTSFLHFVLFFFFSFIFRLSAKANMEWLKFNQSENQRQMHKYECIFVFILRDGNVNSSNEQYFGVCLLCGKALNRLHRSVHLLSFYLKVEKCFRDRLHQPTRKLLLLILCAVRGEHIIIVVIVIVSLMLYSNNECFCMWRTLLVCLECSNVGLDLIVSSCENVVSRTNTAVKKNNFSWLGVIFISFLFIFFEAAIMPFISTL